MGHSATPTLTPVTLALGFSVNTRGGISGFLIVIKCTVGGGAEVYSRASSLQVPGVDELLII